MLKGQEYVSGEALKSELNISRTAVWKNIRGLQELGYNINTIKGKGYHLVSIPQKLYPWELNFFKTTNKYKVRYLSKVDSTNNYARSLELAQVVIAEQQTSGKGRLGREWLSEPGGVYFSLVVAPGCSIEEIPMLPLVIATAITEIMRKNFNVPAEIKWPNDILIKGKKVSGILVELSGETDAPNKTVIGVGINANQKIDHFPSELKSKITTLQEQIGQPINRLKLLDDILEKITEILDQIAEKAPEMLRKWKEFSCTLGQEVSVQQVSKTVKGIAKDIDDKGALIINTAQGYERVLTGDVTLRTFRYDTEGGKE